MTLRGFIVRNAVRNPRRATLSVLSVAVSLFLLVTLLVALREITQPPEDPGASLRIAVRNKLSLTNLLPSRQRAVIERIPGVAAVTPLTWFGGKFRDEESPTFAQFGIDADRLTAVFGDAEIARDELEAWIADRTGCIIGRDTASKYRLSVGDRVTLRGAIYDCDLELVVRGVYAGTLDNRNLFFHQAYLDEATGDTGEVGMWFVRARSAADVPEVIRRIDLAFANSAHEVRAETERAFQMGFVSMWGNIRVFIGSICTVVVFTLLLVCGSTMSMAIRERMRELAVLKALGFKRRELFLCILAESFGLAAAGALLGAGGAWGLFTFVPAPVLTAGYFPMLEVTPRILGAAGAVAVALAVGASVGPGLAVARTSVVEGLKTLD
jgi:putative ABC transport system permease protein